MTLVFIRSLKKHSSLLDLQYFSAVPYALGPLAVKYSARPQAPRPVPFPNPRTDNFLREGMVRQLGDGGVAFDFMLQLQTDPYTMPIEDGLAVWDESASPFRKVATIVIPQQQFTSADQLRCCENASFNPWHCLPEHRPMGAINRVRRIVYKAISEFRHNRNQVPHREPVGEDPCE